MQLGIGTYTYGWAFSINGQTTTRLFTENHLLEKAKSFGLNLVQIGDNLPLHEFTADQLKDFADSAKKNDIQIEVGARGLTAEHLDRYIGIALKLNARLIRLVIDQKDYEPGLPVIINIIQNALRDLEKHHITLGIENHDRLKTSEFVQIVESVSSPNVGICLDSVNSMGAGEGLEQVVKALAPYTVNLHIKDFGIQRLPHSMGFQIDGRPAGKGMLNVPWLLENVSQYGRCQTAILEQWVVPESDPEATIEKEDWWAQESVEYLKNYF
ncbi:sugar phosphate isomerase/epimerase family protein [Dyadobacter pollutisoli]|jgi:sugar phosphate isomerase/epimerase|uniref:TIM barrel protein n=1 Tax=Dyadobacter pollutisoli TaxID=2910158 RepID=A0A9E8NCC1_9BACT|nr:TIM barrel protein [Dyadobacter pollutisoli]WAC14050.1 TIM barrel protein [Dyadobacter pollutisoli]